MILIKVLISTEIRTLDALGNELTCNKNKMEQVMTQLVCHFCQETFLDNSSLHPPMSHPYTWRSHTDRLDTLPVCLQSSLKAVLQWRTYMSLLLISGSWMHWSIYFLAFFCEQTVFSQSQLITSHIFLILRRHVEPKHLQLIIIIF